MYLYSHQKDTVKKQDFHWIIASSPMLIRFDQEKISDSMRR